MNIELENTLQAALNNGINLFLGSGFSILAKDENGSSLPMGNQLVGELISAMGVSELKGLQLEKVSTILKATQLDRFNAFLKKRFHVKSYDPSYGILNKITLGSIITTNIDNLIPTLLSGNQSYYLNNVTKHGTAYNDKTAVNYVPLHGDVEDDKPNFIFGVTELASAFSMDRDKWHYLTHALQAKPTLFWGYGLQDSGVLEALHPSTISQREKSTMWILLYDPDEPTKSYFRALGFNIIIGSTQEFLSYLNEFLSPEKLSVKPILTSKQLFPNYQIPSPANVPQRPLVKFYGGEPPIWSDIFSGRIHKTKFYRIIEDKINARRNCVVTGLAACGKTTLMMQLASGMNVPCHKFVCLDLTLPKADFLIRTLRTERALIFVDNFADEIEAFNLLLRSANILVVGFERDYNYDIVSHRIDEDSYDLIEVTDLDKQDIQAIFANIPPELRKEQLTVPHDVEERPSLFEIIQLNTVLPKLQERFSTVLQHLESTNYTLTDILVMLAYVHCCHTPVSFEMILAFLRNVTTDYQEVYSLVDKLGAMSAEYSDAEIVIAGDQDYFIPRSTIVAEAILSQVPSSILKRVLLTFHNEVSSYRIYRYDTFKRKAFDAEIMMKAFTDWQEGKQFYERAFYLDPSPYLRQQGAIYLSKKRRYQEAFIWIDEALILSRYNIFSIKNSHAIILFKANIDKESTDPTVKETLDLSMEILSKCHSDDKRKLYHALTFADQAIRYHDKYPDDKAKDYFLSAKKWLVEEKAKTSSRNVDRLLNQINTILASYPD